MNRDKLVVILGAALFLSLAGNLFMGGIMLGHSYAPPEQHDQDAARHAEWQKRDEELRRQLSEPDRKVLKQAMQEHRPQFQAMRQELEQARQKVEEAQSAQPFDQQALDAALHDEAEKKSQLVQMMHKTKDEIAQQLSPEGREIFSKVMRARRGEGMGRRRDRGGDDMRPGEGDAPAAGPSPASVPAITNAPETAPNP